MELCIAQTISAFPKLFTTNPTPTATHLRPTPSLTFTHTRIAPSSRPLLHPRPLCFINPVPRATASDETPTGRARASDETSTGPSSYVAVEEKVYGSETGSTKAEPVVVEPEVKEESPSPASASESSLDDFLANLNIKFEDDTYSIILYGGSALVALWLASVIVGAIDSIPLFSKLMELVGLGYSAWFTYRYLLFRKDRDELAAIIEGFKQEVLGSGGD